MKLLTMIAAVLCLSWSLPAQSYGDAGHKMFCQAAFDFSSKGTQQRLQELADQHPRYKDFASICTWADDIKSYSQWDWARSHHYVNFPRRSAKVSLADCPTQGGCILTAIQHHYDVLLHDPDAWTSLAFLAHFVGDLHQPLHVSFADDRGGNQAAVIYYDQPINLHTLWDFGMLEQRNTSAKTLLLEATQSAPIEVTPELTLAWANESAAITRRVYSQYRVNQKLGDAYTAEWGPVLEQRMQQGAQRLAGILDTLYGD